ncbi:HSP20 family protein [Weissella uvarum]|uniref:Hsp20/alpha crystallin family protein n=1 Tax=Weissella uvarum TaxID=1479233 RepID=UPI0019619BC3|nr:Hsp20/alpha crystallin family protein [Weissella uvarum]MBM7616535.1 HSP20 family protein [Weissella uvarum]MCM0595004.1 Hsp20/alpha crystallin family protein [Weissella uvarum]
MSNEVRTYSDLNHLIDQISRGFFNEGTTPAVLGTDVTEADDKYIVHVNVPGVNKDDINMSYHDGVLNIDAKYDHFEDHSDEDTHVLLSERSEGSAHRSFNLAGVDENKISASLDNGVLTIELPKVQEADHKISID